MRTLSVSMMLAGLAALAGCPGTDPAIPDAAPPDGSPADTTTDPGPIDAPPVTPICRHDAPFGPPQLVAEVSTAGANEQSAWLSPDELTMLFTRDAGGDGLAHVYLATRSSRQEPFGGVHPLLAISGTRDEYRAVMSSDLLTLYVDRRRGFGTGYAIYAATRASRADAFGELSEVAAVNDPHGQTWEPALSPGGSLYFASTRGASSDLFVATRTGARFEAPVPLVELNSADQEEAPVPSADGLALYFATKHRGGADTSYDVWVALRPTTDSRFEVPSMVHGLNAIGDDLPSWISPDNCRLYFTSDRGGSGITADDIWVASRQPQ